MELSAEEEKSLRELIEARNSGQEVEEYISNRLYGELSEVVGNDDLNNVVRDYKEGFLEQEQAYQSLGNKGLLELDRYERYGDLTIEGRNFFENKKRLKREKRAEVWSDRRFQIALSIGTLTLSTVLGAIAGAITGQL